MLLRNGGYKYAKNLNQSLTRKHILSVIRGRTTTITQYKIDTYASLKQEKMEPRHRMSKSTDSLDGRVRKSYGLMASNTTWHQVQHIENEL